MRRRAFLASFLALLCAGAACVSAWPTAALAQRSDLPRVVVISPGFTGTTRLRPVYAFLQRMADLGWRHGRNVDFAFQLVDNETTAVTELMRGLAREKIAVVVVVTMKMAFAVQAVAPKMPIVVVAAGDPVAVGAAASLARPGGTITGLSLMSPELAAKRLEHLIAFRPQARRIAILRNPELDVESRQILDLVTQAARDLGPALRIFDVSKVEEIDTIIGEIADWNADGVVVLDDSFLFVARAALVAAATLRKLPLACPFPEMARDGCLFSYSASVLERFVRSSDYVDKILRGASPGELPFDQPTRFELVINLKTAAALGIAVPEILLATADEVIE